MKIALIRNSHFSLTSALIIVVLAVAGGFMIHAEADRRAMQDLDDARAAEAAAAPGATATPTTPEPPPTAEVVSPEAPPEVATPAPQFIKHLDDPHWARYYEDGRQHVEAVVYSARSFQLDLGEALFNTLSKAAGGAPVRNFKPNVALDLQEWDTRSMKYAYLVGIIDKCEQYRANITAYVEKLDRSEKIADSGLDQPESRPVGELVKHLDDERWATHYRAGRAQVAQVAYIARTSSRQGANIGASIAGMLDSALKRVPNYSPYRDLNSQKWETHSPEYACFIGVMDEIGDPKYRVELGAYFEKLQKRFEPR